MSDNLEKIYARTAHITWDNYQVLADLFDFYLSVHAAWGSLHIALEDGNMDRASVQFCLEWAIKHKDCLGAYLASVLLNLTDAGLARLASTHGSMLAFFMEALDAGEVIGE